MKAKFLSNTKSQNTALYNTLTPGKEYYVYGIATFDQSQWYLICEDHYDGINVNYPRWIEGACFNITDGRLSKFWKIGDDKDIYNFNKHTILLGFDELIKEPTFYSKLLEGEEREVRIFSTIKRAMDSEFGWFA